MQNIPSHATDIRHMFRATPSAEEIFECSEDEANSICVSLPRYYSVFTPNGEKKVQDLQLGDEVILQHDGKEEILNVKQMEDSSEDPALCDVVF